MAANRSFAEYEISDVKVEYVWVEDKPDMEIHFDVAASIWFEVQEADHLYDDYDENIVWMMGQSFLPHMKLTFYSIRQRSKNLISWGWKSCRLWMH